MQYYRSYSPSWLVTASQRTFWSASCSCIEINSEQKSEIVGMDRGGGILCHVMQRRDTWTDVIAAENGKTDSQTCSRGLQWWKPWVFWGKYWGILRGKEGGITVSQKWNSGEILKRMKVCLKIVYRWGTVSLDFVTVIVLGVDADWLFSDEDGGSVVGDRSIGSWKQQNDGLGRMRFAVICSSNV